MKSISMIIYRKPIDFLLKYIRTRNVKKFIKDRKDVKVLDIGCGDNYFASLFKNTNIIGIDLKSGQNAEEELNFPDNYFDFVTMIAVIEHFSNYEKVLGEVKRILKTNGLLIITTPFKKAEHWLTLFLGEERDTPHLRHFTKKDFSNFEGFKVTHYSTFEMELNQLIILKKNHIEPIK